MNKDATISAVGECLETGLLEYVYVRVAGALIKADGEELTISGGEGAQFSAKRGAMLEEPSIITVDIETGKKTIAASSFSDLLGKEVSINCYLDKDSVWRATDVFSKTVINKKADA